MSIPDLCQEAAKQLIAEGWEEGYESSSDGTLYIALKQADVRLGIRADKYGASLSVTVEGAIQVLDVTLHRGGMELPAMIVGLVNVALPVALKL